MQVLSFYNLILSTVIKSMFFCISTQDDYLSNKDQMAFYLFTD